MTDTPATGNLLSRKIGGVKVQWLLVIAAVAVAGGIIYRRYRAAHTVADSTVPAPIDTTTAGGDAYGPTAGDGVYSSAGGTNLASGTFAYSGNGAGTSTYSTLGSNQQWATAAANGLIAQHTFSPIDVETALFNYVNGVSLTAGQQTIVNAAIASYGSPPESVLPGNAAIPNPDSTFGYYAKQPNGQLIWGVEQWVNGVRTWTPLTTQAAANAYQTSHGGNIPFANLSWTQFQAKATGH